eukprot:g8352.t1
MVTGCGDNKEDTGALDDDTTIESVVEEETEEPTVTDSTIAEDTTVARPTEPVVVSPVDKTEADESEDVEVACEAGGMLAGMTETDLQALGTYGAKMGLAFQMVDDVLDYTASFEELGKPTGTDFYEGKATLPVILAYQQADEKGRQTLIQGFQQDVREEKHFLDVRTYLEQNGAFEKTFQYAHRFADEAIDALKVLGTSPLRKALEELALFVVARRVVMAVPVVSVFAVNDASNTAAPMVEKEDGGDIYQQHFRAEKGHHGRGANRTGRDGKDLLIRMPVGTQIWNETEEYLIADLVERDQTVCLARGGQGGRGNASFKSSTNQAPRQHDPGTPGEACWIWIQLKLIADVGLVGFPNAGKSTFLSTVSHARPKIADYPFTTLYPQLGVIRLDAEREFVMADLPGLIQGAHEGAGLGHRFLGHVERCQVIFHLINATQASLVQTYEHIRHELKSYGHDLETKPEIILLTKEDLVSPDDLMAQKNQLINCTQSPILSISSATQKGLTEALETAYAMTLNQRAKIICEI